MDGWWRSKGQEAVFRCKCKLKFATRRKQMLEDAFLFLRCAIVDVRLFWTKFHYD
jgi:hypothetical protein